MSGLKAEHIQQRLLESGKGVGQVLRLGNIERPEHVWKMLLQSDNFGWTSPDFLEIWIGKMF
jgi:hypothetical protein